jgi:hypothetical protein
MILSLLLVASVLISQDDPTINLLDTEDGWRKEAFTFPKPFAPQVDFRGIADVRFTKGWSDKSSDYLWSYAFAWKIDLEEKLSDEQLENYLQLYFDGLMRVVNRDTSLKVPATIAVFSSSSTIKNNLDYKGKIRLYDAFFTKEILLLNVNGEYNYCAVENKHNYVFRLSPQSFSNTEVWEHLNKASLRADICRN